MTPERIGDTTCPTRRDGDDEVARRWAAGALHPDEVVEFEAHLRTCTTCQRAVEYAANVTGALRSAAHTEAAPTTLQRWYLPIAIVVVVLVVTLWWFVRSSAGPL